MISSPAPAQNLRIDPIHRQQCLDQAARCRRLAYSISDREASTELLALAKEYEGNAWAARSSPALTGP